MFGNPLVSGHYARGTLCSGIGLIIVAAYYAHAWRHLRSSPEPPLTPGIPDSPGRHPWPALRYLHWGILSSVFLFMFAGAADAGGDWLDRLVGCLMGLCAAIFVGMFGVGFVSLANLWKELVLQLKKARIGSLLLCMPLAILWLAVGLGVLVLLGMFGDKFSNSWGFLFRTLLWGLIAVMFYSLWKGRSHAALMLRLILLASFSATIVAAVAFGFWWITSQTAPLLVIFLSVVGSLNVIFYSRWVRLAALKDNLE